MAIVLAVNQRITKAFIFENGALFAATLRRQLVQRCWLFRCVYYWVFDTIIDLRRFAMIMVVIVAL